MSYNGVKVAHIVATDRNGCIGKDGKMAWHVPADLKRFKELTKGGVVIMGRKTFDSLGCKPLPDRMNVVVTSNHSNVNAPSIDGDLWSSTSIEGALNIAARRSKSRSNDTIWIIGGAEVYRQTMQYVDVIEHTLINVEIDDGDAFYPERDRSIRPVWRSGNINSGSSFDYSYSTYLRFERHGKT